MSELGVELCETPDGLCEPYGQGGPAQLVRLVFMFGYKGNHGTSTTGAGMGPTF